jgi:hypothetical protein
MTDLLARRARPRNVQDAATFKTARCARPHDVQDPALSVPSLRHSGELRNPSNGYSSAMLLLFILIGLLALGLPLMLMLFGDPPAPPAPPLQPKAAVVQPAPPAAPVEVPQAASSEAAPPTSLPDTTGETPQLPQSSIPASPPVKASAAVTAAAPAAAKPGASVSEAEPIPGLPEGGKLPSEAELLRELQRLLEERAKAGK